MPRVSVWFVRAALLYLGAGFTLGALLLADKGVGFSSGLWRWLPVHFELLLVGWFVQLVMGVAYWIFPRFGMSRAARGREGLAWLALALLNIGVMLVCGAAIGDLPGLAVVGRAAELSAAGTLALNVWARTRASGISAM
jgi:hypothetical protein